MKKIKWAIMTSAILLSIGGAFATKQPNDCTSDYQYYLSGTNYVYAGVMGVNYLCYSSSNTCTYYWNTNDSQYEGCQTGNFSLLEPPGIKVELKKSIPSVVFKKANAK